MKRNIAVIGCGYWGKNHVRVLDELGYLGAICDSDLNKKIVGDGITSSKEKMVYKYRHVAQYMHYRDVLMDKNISAVVVATPANTHYEITSTALDFGTHVLVEKPMAMGTVEADRMIGAAENSHKILMVGHILEYHPAVIALEKYIKGGHLGELQYLYSNRLNIGRIRKEESVLWSFAPHDIALIRTIVGALPLSVGVKEVSYLTEGVSDITIMHLDFSGGIKAHIFVSWLHPVKEQKFVVIGSKAMAVFDDQTNEKVKIYEHKIEWREPSEVAHIDKAEYKVLCGSSGGVEPLKAELKHFVECCETGKNPKTGGAEGREVLKILEGRK